MSTGGSREATLPSKDNPNPDLSDINDESEADTAIPPQPEMRPEAEVMNSEPLDLRDSSSQRQQEVLEQEDMFQVRGDLHLPPHLHDSLHMDTDDEDSEEEEIHVS